MISVEEALKIIHSNLFTPEAEKIDITKAHGRILAESIEADRDFPPFDRVMMDGIAINYNSFINGQKEFVISGVQFAGSPVLKLNDPTKCIEVMTGAMLPIGVDTVIRYEDISIDEGKAKILIDQITKGQNIHKQGLDQAKSDILIPNGKQIGAPEIGILASVGKSEMMVYKWPKVAIISTGDELVDVKEIPEPYQIRKSNSYTMAADLSDLGINANVFHLNDVEKELKNKLEEMQSKYDVFILSGGVSKGKKDYLPKIFDELNIDKLFHRVAQRPGKPFWFGKNEKVTVFALPGNPVSTFFCFNLYFKSWLNKSYKQEFNMPNAVLMTDITFQPELDYFIQVRVELSNGEVLAYPDNGNGSGDLANLLSVNGFMQLPSDRTQFRKGEKFPVILFRSLS